MFVWKRHQPTSKITEMNYSKLLWYLCSIIVLFTVLPTFFGFILSIDSGFYVLSFTYPPSLPQSQEPFRASKYIIYTHIPF